MAAAYSKRNPTIPTLRILDPMVSRPESMQLLEAMTFDPWWDLMESIDLLQLVVHPHPMEEPHLRVVGDLTNPRRFGVAWTEAGRRASREREEWNRRAF